MIVEKINKIIIYYTNFFTMYNYIILDQTLLAQVNRKNDLNLYF